MFDARIRPVIDPPLNAAGRKLAAAGISADQMTVAGFLCGMVGAVAISLGWFAAAFAAVALNRLADGLDGAIARATVQTDRGAFLDISLDFVFYGAIPLGFAIEDPAANALPAAMLLASFLANGAAFLAFAVMAERRKLVATAQGAKSLYYVAGLAEGAETVILFLSVCTWPPAFPWVAAVFAVSCCASAAARLMLGWVTFGPAGRAAGSG